MSTDQETPKYKVVHDLRPSPNPRHRLEPPFTTIFDSSVWQYCEQRPLASGEIIESREWPHPSMKPLNESARRVLQFFNGAIKSRLARSPYHDGRLLLDTGLSGPSEPQFSLGRARGDAA